MRAKDELMSKVEPHVERMLTESHELADRTLKLAAFFDTPVFSGLKAEDKDLLHAQHAAMGAYRTILNIRIGRARAA
jgi:hypothetical protein